LDKLLYKIEVSADSFKTIYDFYDQTISSKGWSKASYNVGDTSKYIPLQPFPLGSYQWRAYAYDGYVWSDGWKIKNPVPTAYGKFDFTTNVAEGAKLPTAFGLEQNYPNPFNPETTILYELPRAGQVEVAVFNLLGEKVRVLLNQPQQAGQHRLLWNGRDENEKSVPSGVYFYRLQAGEFVQTRKMILMQ